MGMNMGIHDWIQRNKNQQAPQDVQQAVASSDVPQELTHAQKLANDGQLTIEQAAKTAQSAQDYGQSVLEKFREQMGGIL